MRPVKNVLELLADATTGLITEAGQDLVTWATGQQRPAEMVVRSRLAEVLIHHVDLRIGFRPASWPAPSVRDMLDLAVQALNDHSLSPPTARLNATDTGRSLQLAGGAADTAQISGTEAELLAWLLGRSDGAGLARDNPGPLPPIPSIYFT